MDAATEITTLESTLDRTLIELPGQPLTFCDPFTVVCVRADPDAGLVVVHTDQGFAFGLKPTADDETLAALARRVLAAVSPSD